MTKKLSREDIIESLKNRDKKFKNLSNKQKEDPEIALIGALVDYSNLKLIEDNIKSNRDFAHYCMHSSGYSMKYMPDCIKNDIELAKIAVNTSPFCFAYLGDIPRNDKEVAKIAVENGCSLAMLFGLYTDDDEIIKIAVKRSGLSLEYASERLKADRDIVLMAVESNPDSIKFADKKFIKLCENKDPVMAIKEEMAREQAENLRNELSESLKVKTKKNKI